MRVALGTLELSTEEAARVGRAARGPESRSNAPATRDQARDWAVDVLDRALGRASMAKVLERTASGEPQPAPDFDLKAPVVTRPGDLTAYDPSGAAALQRAVRAAWGALSNEDPGFDREPAAREALRPVLGWCGIPPEDVSGGRLIYTNRLHPKRAEAEANTADPTECPTDDCKGDAGCPDPEAHRFADGAPREGDPL